VKNSTLSFHRNLDTKILIKISSYWWKSDSWSVLVTVYS